MSGASFLPACMFSYVDGFVRVFVRVNVCVVVCSELEIILFGGLLPDLFVSWTH